MNKTIWIVGFLALAASVARAGSPWSQPDGGGYAQAAVYLIPAYDELFGGDDVFVTSREITDMTVEAYLEHGVGGGWTLVGTLPFKVLDAGGQVAEGLAADPARGGFVPRARESTPGREAPADRWRLGERGPFRRGVADRWLRRRHRSAQWDRRHRLRPVVQRGTGAGAVVLVRPRGSGHPRRRLQRSVPRRHRIRTSGVG